VLWRCRTRAAISDDDPDALAPLVFTKNVRELVGAKNGYYGNCLAIQMVLATRGTVASSGIKDLVKLIKLAKEKMPDILLENANGGTDDHEAHEQQAPPRYNALTLTSWRNLGFEAVDFGSGGASRVMWRTEQTVGVVCVVCPPCKEMMASTSCPSASSRTTLTPSSRRWARSIYNVSKTMDSSLLKLYTSWFV